MNINYIDTLTDIKMKISLKRSQYKTCGSRRVDVDGRRCEAHVCSERLRNISVWGFLRRSDQTLHSWWSELFSRDEDRRQSLLLEIFIHLLNGSLQLWDDPTITHTSQHHCSFTKDTPIQVLSFITITVVTKPFQQYLGSVLFCIFQGNIWELLLLLTLLRQFQKVTQRFLEKKKSKTVCFHWNRSFYQQQTWS